MSLRILYLDELKGFYKSKVMLFLWAGMPALTILLYLAAPSMVDGLPLSFFAVLIVSTLGGALASVMLVVSIINEKTRHVYDLFVIRPVKRRDIVLSKFMAVFCCVAIAASIALAFGLSIDFFRTGTIPVTMLSDLGGSLLLALSMIAISCAAGILIGVVAPSILVGVILVIYGGNQLTAVAIAPFLLISSEPWFPVIPGVAISALLLAAAITIFNRKQL